MSIFQPPIPQDSYCRKHGSYSGYTCPDCISEREKERKDRICPFCQQTRAVNVKYMYCTNSKCERYLIMELKEKVVCENSLYEDPPKNASREIISEHRVTRCRICGLITLVQESETWHVCIHCKACGSTPESVQILFIR